MFFFSFSLFGFSCLFGFFVIWCIELHVFDGYSFLFASSFSELGFHTLILFFSLRDVQI